MLPSVLPKLGTVFSLSYSSAILAPLLQYSCLGNPMDRRTWWAVHRVEHDLVTNNSN